LTIAGNIVTDSSLQQTATEREDEQYQGAFESEYKSNVVGKKISELSLSRVAGASLTNDGFNSALADIENQAKA
jgi:K+/H+ antiporter YhaU regulatory subunit KhtT